MNMAEKIEISFFLNQEHRKFRFLYSGKLLFIYRVSEIAKLSGLDFGQRKLIESDYKGGNGAG